MNELRKELLEQNIRPPELAKLLNAPYRTVQNWFYGLRNPPRWLQLLVIDKIRDYVNNRNADRL